MGTATMRIDWDVVHKAEGSHFGWVIISTDSSEEIIALCDCMYVIISGSSGALWIRYYAGSYQTAPFLIDSSTNIISFISYQTV